VIVSTPAHHVLADLTGSNALMALAHLAAATVVGLWLAMGERALWTVVTLTSQRGEGLVRAAIGGYSEIMQTLSGLARSRRPALVPVTAVRADQKAPELLLLSRAVVRRGPPYLLAA
jgi:hypothetical protein